MRDGRTIFRININCTLEKRSADRRHALSDHFLRVALHLPFPEQVLQFLSALLVQAYGEPFPAQRDPVAGDKDEFPAEVRDGRTIFRININCTLEKRSAGTSNKIGIKRSTEQEDPK